MFQTTVAGEGEKGRSKQSSTKAEKINAGREYRPSVKVKTSLN